MIRVFIIAFALLQGCSQFQINSDATNSKPDDTLSNTPAPSLEEVEVATFDDLIKEYRPEPLTLPHAPSGWLIESEHQPVFPELSTSLESSGDLFDRIRAGFQLDLETDNKRIQAQLNWYVRNPEYVERVFTRSARYMHHIVKRLDEEGLPMELALLPVVESAFNPFAYSHGRASGLWQFIPGTGRMYDLHQSWWYDGRRDVLASTEAAIRYLSWLNKKFDGNWLHALASYNTGSARVARSIKRNEKLNRGTDFWSLKLPRETRAYVPKLIAISKIVANPEKYNIKLNPIPNEAYFDIVKLDSQIDLAQAATLAGLDIEEIYQLNPGLNQWATPPTGPHRLLVPKANKQPFEAALANLPKSKRLTWDNYKVKSGDSLGLIAKRFFTTPTLIKQVNRLRNNTIYEGQSLMIPVASQNKQFYSLNEQNRIASKQAKVAGKAGTSRVFYKVKTGDTFWDIAMAHKVGVRQLAKWNGMAPGDVLRPGKELLIWSKAKHSGQSATKKAAIVHTPSLNTSYAPRDSLKRIKYRVRRGDSLWRIANHFNVTVKELKSWNKIGNKKYLQPGQRLTVFVDITQG